jgi:molecular chaperone GrpE
MATLKREICQNNIMLGKKKTEDTVKTEEAIKTEPTVQELMERLARMQADFENFRKRTEKEKAENLINANANLITQLLQVLDNFELSLKHNQDRGVSMIYDDFRKILERQGLKVIDTSGAFDAKVHEVLMQADGDSPGKILEEFQKGYLLNEKLLRASKVKIVKVSKDE